MDSQAISELRKRQEQLQRMLVDEHGKESQIYTIAECLELLIYEILKEQTTKQEPSQ